MGKTWSHWRIADYCRVTVCQTMPTETDVGRLSTDNRYLSWTSTLWLETILLLFVTLCGGGGGESLFERGWVMENLCLSRISGRNWDMEKRFSYIFTSVLLSLGYMSYFVSRARTTICFKCIFLASTNKQWINKSSLWNKYFTSLLRILELIYVQSYCRITVRLLYD